MSSSPIPFAIHGFGRIGRALARAAHGHPGLQLVAVNDRAPVAQWAPLLARDSVHGRFPTTVELEAGGVRIGGRSVAVFGHRVPAEIPWHTTSARVVVDCSGTVGSSLGGSAADPRGDGAELGVAADGVRGHLRPGGPGRVLISALAADADLTLCRGVNDDAFDAARHVVVSAGSCTTNCLALLALVLDRAFGIRQALMSEVHSYTSNQSLVDGPHPDPRRARAAGLNIVPTTTAAPDAVATLMPHLAGRVAGQAIRVPTPDVALLDLVVTLERAADADALRAAFVEAAAGPLHGLLATSDEPLVSSDYQGDRHSAVVDLPLVQSLPAISGGHALHRVSAWYDNETGYAHRLAELVCRLGASEPSVG